MKTQPARKPRTGPSGRAGTTVSPARLAAFDILRRVENEGAFASALLATLDDDMRPDDRALCHEVVLGVQAIYGGFFLSMLGMARKG